MLRTNELRMKAEALDDAVSKARTDLDKKYRECRAKIYKELFHDGVRVWDKEIGIELPAEIYEDSKEEAMILKMLKDKYNSVEIKDMAMGIRTYLGLKVAYRCKYDHGDEIWYTLVERKPAFAVE